MLPGLLFEARAGRAAAPVVKYDKFRLCRSAPRVLDLLTMWGRKRQSEPQAGEHNPSRLKDAVREARIESAERAGVVVDLRDAELARLELLNEALDPLFGEIPDDVELFERGISHGNTPRLWIDAVAHVVMGRDKRMYRFVQDSRYGRKVLAESFEPAEIVAAVTRYVARRLVERERALTESPGILTQQAQREALELRWRRRRRALRAFLFGLIVGVVALFAVAWWMAPPP
jgi:hypothetical protein